MFAAPAGAHGTSLTLDRIASGVVGRPVTITCVANISVAGDVPIVWDGKTPHPANHARVSARYCRLASQLVTTRTLDPDNGYLQFYALDTVLHEAVHMAGAPGWMNESVVECKALHATARLISRLHIAGFPAWWLRFEWQHQPPAFRSAPCHLS